MSKITLGCSLITNTIYAGKLNKAGNQWVGTKYDVTDEAILVVMEHIYHKAIDNNNELEEIFIKNHKGYELKVSARKVKEETK